MIKQLLPAQDDFVFSEAPFPAIVGGLGSGKSEGGILRIIRLMLEYPQADFAYYMPSYDLLKLRAIPGFEAFLNEANITYTLNKTESIIDVKGYGKIIFRSYDNPKRIIAYEVAHSIVDEIDTLKKEEAEIVWRKVTERNRQNIEGMSNTISVVTTPDMGTNGFVYHKWVKLQQDGYELIKARTRDNPFLPDDYVQNILNNYDPILADLYLNGEFVALNQNKVYHFFNRRDHHTNRALTKDDQFIFVGLDFNIGGTCAVVFVIDGGVPIAVDEFISHDTYDFVNRMTKYSQYKAIVFPDASGAQRSTNATKTDIQIIRDAGLSVEAPRENGSVRDRINSCNGLFAHNRIKINTDKCPNLTNALEVQGYDKKGNPEKSDTHPAPDDFLDSFGYFIVRRFPLTKNNIATSSFQMR